MAFRPHNTVAALPAFCEKCNGPLDILDILLVFALTLGPARQLLICRVGAIVGTLAAVHLCILSGSLLAGTSQALTTTAAHQLLIYTVESARNAFRHPASYNNDHEKHFILAIRLATYR